MQHDLSFEALLGRRDAITSLAYWMGPCREFDVTQEELLAFHSVMSANYDVEEQSECNGRVCSTFEPCWHESFVPIMPVQVVEAWSPFPLAWDLMGEPAQWAIDPEDSSLRSVAMFWTANQVLNADVPPIEPPGKFAQRFIGILRCAVRRAQDLASGVVLGGCPGWSYEHAHPMPEWIAESMRTHGYILTDRRPP